MTSLIDYPAFKIARYVTRHLRELARYLIVSDRSMPHLGRQICETARRLMRDGNVQVHTDLVETSWASGLTPDQQRELHLIAEECLTNVLRHANARNIWLMLRFTPTGVSFAIRDDGTGFAPGVESIGTGFQRIRQRASTLNAALHIGSTPNYGTSIRIECPVRTSVPADVPLPTASRQASA